jgi:hypothetical protein
VWCGMVVCVWYGGGVCGVVWYDVVWCCVVCVYDTAFRRQNNLFEC